MGLGLNLRWIAELKIPCPKYTAVGTLHRVPEWQTQSWRKSLGRMEVKTALWDKTKLFEALNDTELRVKEWMSAVECMVARKARWAMRAEASERANGRASGPVLTFQFLTDLAHRRDQIACRIVHRVVVVVVVVVVVAVVVFAMSIPIWRKF